MIEEKAIGNPLPEVELRSVIIEDDDHEWLVDEVELELERFDSDGYITVALPFASKLITVKNIDGKIILFHRWEIAAAQDEAEIHGFLMVGSGRIVKGRQFTVLLHMGTVRMNNSNYHIYRVKKEF